MTIIPTSEYYPPIQVDKFNIVHACLCTSSWYLIVDEHTPRRTKQIALEPCQYHKNLSIIELEKEKRRKKYRKRRQALKW